MKYSKTISVILISSLIFSACSSKKNNESTSVLAGTPVAEKAAIPVKALTLSKTKIARTIDYTSTVLPFEEVNIVPSTPGRIEKIYVETGDKVTKGKKLFLMDRSQLYQLKLQLTNLEKDLRRLDTLLSVGSARQQDYDQMKTQYDVLKTNVDFMEQNTLMAAPFTGIITGKYFEDGEMYSGTPTTQTGRSAIVTIMQINPLKLNVSISEQYYPLIKNGMKAKVTADVYSDKTFEAKVFNIHPTINAATRSFLVELELPNPSNLLKPGMYVRIAMDLGEVETFVVPAATVLLQEGTNIRYIFIDDNGIAKRIEVMIGKRFDDKLEIISDELKDGVSVITEGQSKLLNDDKIAVTI